MSIAAQHVENPTQEDWTAVKRIFRYLRGTMSHGIYFDGSTKGGELLVYSDADFAGDLKSRRSRSGVVSMYAGGPISWFSRKQNCIVLSTTEAEYIAGCEAAKEAIWLARLMKEMGQTIDVPQLLIDNMSAVKLAGNPQFHRRTKHIDIRYHFLREKVCDGMIDVKHVAGTSQIADILTKGVQKLRFYELIALLGVTRK